MADWRKTTGKAACALALLASTACAALLAPRRQSPTVRMVREPAPGGGGEAGPLRGAAPSSLPWTPAPDGSASAPLPPDVLARALDAAVRSARDAYMLPGAAIVLLRRHGKGFCRGYGVTALPPAASAPVDVRTAFACNLPLPPGPAALGPAARRATGHVVELRQGKVAPLRANPAAAGAPPSWLTAQDWAGRLTQAWAGEGGWRFSEVGGGQAPATSVPPAADAPAGKAPPWRRRYDVAGFVADVAAWPARGVALVVLVNAGAGPGIDALLAQVHGVVVDYTPAPAGD